MPIGNYMDMLTCPRCVIVDFQVIVKTMNTKSISMYEWKALPWRAIERAVFKLQKRIYKASVNEDLKRVHQLQKLLIKSHCARLLAIRKVT